MVIVLSLILVFSMSSCSKIADRVEKKMQEKANEVIDGIGDEEGVVDEDEESDNFKEGLKKVLAESEDEDEDKSDKKSNKSDKKDKKKKERKKKSKKKAKKDDFDLEKFVENLDENLKDEELLMACAELFEHSPFEDSESLHWKSSEFNAHKGEELMIDMYKDGDDMYMQTSGSSNEEDNVLMIINTEDELIYMIMGDGNAYKMPYTPETAKSNNANLDFDMDDEDFDGLIEASVEDYEGEKCLFVSTKEEDGMYTDTWYSLERAIPILMQEYDDNEEVSYEVVTMEFETGGDYDEMFEAPEDVDFGSMGDMISGGLKEALGGEEGLENLVGEEGLEGLLGEDGLEKLLGEEGLENIDSEALEEGLGRLLKELEKLGEENDD